MEKVRVAVIGAGTIAEVGHLPYYQQSDDVELVAIADMNYERALNMAEKFGVRNAYQNVEEMFNNEQLHAVSICTPNASHVPLAIQAVQRGIDVLIEKPMGVNYEEAKLLQNEVRKAKRICMIGMTHRFRNEVKAMKRFVDSGNLGDLYYVKAKILRRRGTPTGWFTDKAKSGGGPLMDIGVHVLDLAWWLAGQPQVKSVSGHLVKGIGSYNTEMLSSWQSADQRNRSSIFDVEDFASAFLRFSNGVVLQLEVSWAVNGPQDEAVKVDLYGTKGGLSLDPLVYYTEENNILLESKLIVDRNDPMKDEIYHFIDSVKQHQEPLIPVEQGVSMIQMLESIVNSSNQQSEVKIIE